MAKKISTTATKIAAAQKSGPPKSTAPLVKHLSTGVSVFNLILSGNVDRGLQTGTYAFLVGDSSAGKSFLATTIAAQAAINPEFDSYKIYYDDVEHGALFDVPRLFSPEVAERIQPPPNGESDFIEEFYVNATTAVNAGPCIYILDSENALTSRDEAAKAAEIVSAVNKATAAGKDVEAALKALAGSYGDGKARKHSANLRTLVRKVEKTGSILIILGQTRDNLSGEYEDVVYSGGRALKFYSHVLGYMSVGGAITRTVHEIKRQIGFKSRLQIFKNRYIGKRSTTSCPLYYTHGYDEVGGLIDWLLTEKIWTVDGKVNTHGFMPNALQETLIKRIETDESLEEMLREFVQNEWNDIENKCKVARRNRYTVGRAEP
jgi:RecA/RadA recombinase